MISTIRNFLTVCILLGLISSCGSDDQQKEAQRKAEEQMRKDSIAQAKADSVARARADSLAKMKKKQQEEQAKEKEEELTLEDINFAPNGSFSVQVEAWRSQEKAEAQVGKWKKRGFSNAYVVKYGTEDTGNVWFRVRVGKVASEQMADKLAELIQKKYNEKTWVTDISTAS